MEKLSILVNTQTPLVQFLPPADGSAPHFPAEVELAALKEEVDYRFSPGGVTRMVYPLLERLRRSGLVGDADWVSLNPTAPAIVRLPGLTLHNVAIDPARMGGYGKAKEAIWSTAHGLNEPGTTSGLFWTDDFAEYTYYNRTTAEAIRALDEQRDYDLFYIHDFQQLPVGRMLGTLKPKIFRWHIPFDVERIPDAWRPPFETYLSAYDVVVVSSDRYLQALRRFGHQGDVRRMYPYVDPSEYRRPKRAEVEEVAGRFHLHPRDQVALVVARMDPTKGQDRALAAVARLRERFPHLKLVLVGNGSFSSARGGLGLSKSEVWRRHLMEATKELGLEERVVFTGHVDQHELDCLYDRSAFTILPSVNEGFGLVVVESWLHRRPTLVTDRAGVAELIEDGQNGILFDPDDPEALAARMARVLQDRNGLRRRLVEHGHRTSEKCSVDVAAESEGALITELVEA